MGAANAIVFCVDSTDRLRMCVARDELWLALEHRDMAHRRVPLLILATKGDERGALSTQEIGRELVLEAVRATSRPCHICVTCVTPHGMTGVQEAFDWLAQAVKQTMSDESQ